MVIRKILIALAILYFSLFIFSQTASAKVISQKRGVVTVAEGEVVNDDLFVGGELVEINGIVNGDVFAGGETVRLNGTINGDLHIAAGIVELAGTVTDDVYIGAGTVRIWDTTIGGSLILGSGEAYLSDATYIGSSLIAGAGLVDTKAKIGRNALIGAGAIAFDSVLGGEARLASGDISVGSNSVVGGDLYYMLDADDREIKVSNEASVSGSITRLKADADGLKRVKSGASAGWKAFKISFDIFSFLGAVAVGLVGIKLFPKQFEEVTKIVKTKTAKSIGIGFLVAVTFVPAVVGIMLTLVGIPFALILLILVILEMYFAKLFVGLSVGSWILPKVGVKKSSPYGEFIAGLFIIYLAKAIPFIGFFVSVIVLLTGLGAQVIYKKAKLFSK